MRFPKRISSYLKTLFRSLSLPLLLLILYLCFYGVPLLGLPGKEEISCITLEASDGRRRDIREPEETALLLKSARLLNTRLTGKAEGCPCLTLTFYLKEGGQFQLKAGPYAVWYGKKPRPLKQEKLFVHVAEGLFLSDTSPETGVRPKEDTE